MVHYLHPDLPKHPDGLLAVAHASTSPNTSGGLTRHIRAVHYPRGMGAVVIMGCRAAALTVRHLETKVTSPDAAWPDGGGASDAVGGILEAVQTLLNYGDLHYLDPALVDTWCHLMAQRVGYSLDHARTVWGPELAELQART